MNEFDFFLSRQIGDFGLARDLDGGNSSYYVSQGGKVPIKWTAPEVWLPSAACSCAVEQCVFI